MQASASVTAVVLPGISLPNLQTCWTRNGFEATYVVAMHYRMLLIQPCWYLLLHVGARQNDSKLCTAEPRSIPETGATYYNLVTVCSPVAELHHVLFCLPPSFFLSLHPLLFVSCSLTSQNAFVGVSFSISTPTWLVFCMNQTLLFFLYVMFSFSIRVLTDPYNILAFSS